MLSLVALCFSGRQVDKDRDRTLSSNLTRPADHEFLDVRVKVAFSKRERVERVKDLPNVPDTDLNGAGQRRLAPRPRAGGICRQRFFSLHSTHTRFAENVPNSRTWPSAKTKPLWRDLMPANVGEVPSALSVPMHP